MVSSIPSPLALANNAQNIAFLHDQQVFAVELDLGAGPFAEQDAIARLDVERGDLAVIALGAAADGDNLTLLGLFLGGIRNDDAAGRLFLGLDAANQHAIVQRSETHICPFPATRAGYGATRLPP